MVIFHSYVSLPEGNVLIGYNKPEVFFQPWRIGSVPVDAGDDLIHDESLGLGIYLIYLDPR